MENITTIKLRHIEDYAGRAETANNAARRLMQRVLGCWQHDLSRPFSHRGQTYRVCLKCGMARDFNLENFKTQGPSYRLPADLSYSGSTSIQRKAA